MHLTLRVKLTRGSIHSVWFQDGSLLYCFITIVWITLFFKATNYTKEALLAWMRALKTELTFFLLCSYPFGVFAWCLTQWLIFTSPFVGLVLSWFVIWVIFKISKQNQVAKYKSIEPSRKLTPGVPQGSVLGNLLILQCSKLTLISFCNIILYH